MSNDIVGIERLDATLDRMIEALSPAGQKRLMTRIARRIAAENRKRIGANIAPDGTPFAPRKRRGKGIRAKMFQKLKTTAWLKAKTFPNGVGASIFFAGGGAPLARIHHYGLRGRLARGSNLRIQYPARPLLGFRTPTNR
jgi:phage virion morphogenesis protein